MTRGPPAPSARGLDLTVRQRLRRVAHPPQCVVAHSALPDGTRDRIFARRTTPRSGRGGERLRLGPSVKLWRACYDRDHQASAMATLVVAAISLGSVVMGKIAKIMKID